MNLTKDVYEYLLNFADDREILNMLSVNKKFRDDKLFERVMKRRYPLIIRFKAEGKSWREFYIETIFYLGKLEEGLHLPYIPTLDFNPEVIYKNSLNKEYKRHFVGISKNIDFYRGKGYHTIGYKTLDGRYEIDPNLHKEYSMSFYGIINDNKNIIDMDKPLDVENNMWLALLFHGEFNETSGLYLDREEGIKFLYNDYLYVVYLYIQKMIMNALDIWEHSNLEKGWDSFQKFKDRLDDHLQLILYKNIPNRGMEKYYFQIVRVNIPN